MNIHQKIEQYIVHHKLLHHNDTLIIGLSGGPDSVFLLHTLISLQSKYNLTLIAAHLNHEWRHEAHDEEALCHTIAQKHNIPCVSAKLSSLQSNIKYNGSKEEYARKMRRFFLENVAREYNAHHIALGHHAQDQQETFFMRLIRGSSLAGLTAMHPQQGMYIRPLLEINKEEILHYLHTHTIAYAIDASNTNQDFLRNRIRTTVLPSLSECDSRFDNNFALTLQRLHKENALLDSLTKTALASILITIDNTQTLDVSKFIALDSALHHRLIIQWLISYNVQFPITSSFLDEIIRFLFNPNGGTHTVHKQWSIVKKQKKAFIIEK